MTWNAWGIRSCALAVVVISAVSCGGSDGTPSSGADSADAAVARGSDRLAVTFGLARSDRALSRFLDLSERGFEASGDTFTSHGWRGVGAGSARIAARVAARADGTYEIGLGPDPEHAIRLTREGASGAEAELDGGRLTYQEAYPATDLVAVATLERFEELLLLHTPSAPTRFSWRVRLPPSIPFANVQADGSLAFLDPSGQPAVHLAKPFALDARGRKRDASLRFVGDRIVIDLDPTGLEYPVLLDPAYDVGAWTQVGSTAPPAGRYLHAMTYHAASNVVLMFGGYDITSFTPTLSDAWTWNGSTWSSAASGPPARRTHAMAYDAARGETVMFGGYNGTPIGDTWVYTTAGGWVQKCTACTVSERPQARYGHAMAYDSVLKRVLLFGGNCGVAPGVNNEIWAWDGATGKWSQRCGAGCTPPTERQQHAMAYDALHARTVIYGGTYTGGINDVTVLYNSATDTFTTATTVATTPPALGTRVGPGMGYDSIRNKMLVYGGKLASTSQGDVWQWDGTTWGKLDSGTGPTARNATPFVFDTALKRFVMFSGDVDAAPEPPDTWTFYVKGDQCSTGTTCDTGYCVDGVCCSAASCGTCSRCDPGSSAGSGSGSCTPVLSADDPDTCTGTNTCDASGNCKKKLGQGCSAGSECVSGFCVDGTCCKTSSCATECRSCADSNGGCSALVTNQDDDNCNGTQTCSASALCKSKNGQSCTLATDCASNNCVDSTCCADACTTPCRSCGNSAGTCTTLVTNQEDGTACSGVNSCDATGACKKKNGQGCSAGTECVSGNCADSYCCNTACSGGCDVCAAGLGASQNGVCTVLSSGSAGQCGAYKCKGSATCPSSCSGDADCTGGNYCSGGSCVAKLANGQSCSAANVCSSGFCADGVCCNTACDQTCMACAASNKQSGTNSGTCDVAKQGTNPNNKCVVDSSNVCGDVAACKGSAAECAKAAFGTSCGPTTCNAGSVSGKVCDGTGTCVDQTNASCSPYVCASGACSSPCSGDTDCVTGYYCSSGTCVAKSDNGLGCGTANQCKSSFCVDGVCCDAPCTGQCEACDATGSVGQCKAVTGGPHGSRPACNGSGTCQGSCDGADPTKCAFPGSATSCATASCTGDVSQPAGSCDGTGSCTVPATKNCAPYACDSATGACKTTCAATADCSQGATCDSTTGQCTTASATCQDAYTVKLANGQTQSCSPYKCVGGACQQQCATSGDCAPGYECQGTACVPTSDAGTGGGSGTGGASSGGSSSGGSSSGGAAGSGGQKPSSNAGDDGGCGCRVAGERRSDGALLLLIALGATLGRRRRNGASL